MSAAEIIEQINRLSSEDQKEVFAALTAKLITPRREIPQLLGKKLSFEEACDVVFRENHELLQALQRGDETGGPESARRASDADFEKSASKTLNEHAELFRRLAKRTMLLLTISARPDKFLRCRARSKPRRGGLFIDGRIPPSTLFCFSAARRWVWAWEWSKAAPPKNKRGEIEEIPVYKQATPTGFQTQISK